MAKILLKGIVKKVMPVENYGTGDNAGRRQSVILFVPSYRDSWGELKGKDQEWRLDIFNDKIDKLGLNDNLLEKKVEAVVYVSSQRLQRKEDSADMWMISAILGEMRLYEVTNQPINQKPQSNGNGNSW